ncbi:hypothetical protein CXB51_016795 [Gossypium anomalum]|uniref:Uncharacterized protein n=1 Tax=Gossypium anomalum TaxID=47600 RepID=A0A8J5Z0D0_9ROSI|nr:hypothetical protein CXB51_016795 [Gossypium anomalum]
MVAVETICYNLIYCIARWYTLCVFRIPVSCVSDFYSLCCKLSIDGHFEFFCSFSCISTLKINPFGLFTLGVVISLSTSLANVSLKYNSVGFYQMAKIVVTPSIVLAEFIWYKKKVTFSKAIIVVHQVDRNMLVLKLEGKYPSSSGCFDYFKP